MSKWLQLIVVIACINVDLNQSPLATFIKNMLLTYLICPHISWVLIKYKLLQFHICVCANYNNMCVLVRWRRSATQLFGVVSAAMAAKIVGELKILIQNIIHRSFLFVKRNSMPFQLKCCSIIQLRVWIINKIVNINKITYPYVFMITFTCCCLYYKLWNATSLGMTEKSIYCNEIKLRSEISWRS